MKAIALILVSSLFFTQSFAQKNQFDNQNSSRIEKIINSQWTFNYFPATDKGKGYELPGFDDSRWPAISLPHTWDNYETTKKLINFKNADGSDNPYWKTGYGWYRKHFSVSREFAGRRVFIELAGINKYCKVWINGKYLGEHIGTYGSFDFDITSDIKPGDDNLLAICVSSITKNNTKTPEVYISGGIFNGVRIVIKDNLFIPMQDSESNEGETYVTTPQVSEKEAVVRVQTYVKNNYQQKVSCNLLTNITDDAGKIIQSIKSEAEIEPGQLFRFDQTCKPIKNPHLWSDGDPYLYKIESSITKGKIVTDSYSRPLFFRLLKSDSKENALISDTASTLKSTLTDFISDKKVTATSASSEQPVKIVLTGVQNKIPADRGSVVKINADILDSKGNRTGLSNYTLKWIVSGPATLVGPEIYDQNLLRDILISNAIRSTGKPGKIHVSLTASGLISGSYDIEAVEQLSDNSVIQEPVLQNDGRKQVNREVQISRRLTGVPVEINPVQDEIIITLEDKSDKPKYKKLIRDYISKNNPVVDTSSVELNYLTEIFAVQLSNSEGRIQPEDYNFSTGNFNNCRLIARYINSTKLPQFFKDGLRKYYSDAVIKKGNEKDAGDEMNWLNWIPSGGTVVMVQSDKLTETPPKGVILTNSTDLKDIIAAVYPQFANFSTEAKERALFFTGKVNPYVHTVETSGSLNNGDNLQGKSYVAEKGQPILIPLLKFISE